MVVKKSLRVLIVASELAPFAKVGGLADVTGALTKHMFRLGHDVRVVVPFYRSIRERVQAEGDLGPLRVRIGTDADRGARLWKALYPGTEAEVYFVEYNEYYDRAAIYTGEEGGYADNDRRFAFLSRAALDACYDWDWMPDVIHCHDWPTALIPVYLNTTEANSPLGRAATVYTVHNLAHQGVFGRELLEFARLPDSLFTPDGLESMGRINLMKGALYHATRITTVSPTYSREIQTPEYGCGLHHVLRHRSADLIGILNGIDVEVWNPATDVLLPARYSAGDLQGKAQCKAVLQEKVGLEVQSQIPLFGVVSRLYEQKGLDLLASIGSWLMDTMAVQVVVLGAGDSMLEKAFYDLSQRYPGRFAALQGYDEELSHLIEAGSDFFIMPSRFEPCGLNQMYSMAYGTPPLVRATGGLLDTVEQYIEGEGRGTGFLFHEASESALYYTIGWACSTYYDRPDELDALRLNGMMKDFSWHKAALRYNEVYEWAVDARAQGWVE